MGDEVFEQLEREYQGTKIVTVVQREEGPPNVQWDANTLTENDVVANLFKALLFMTLDEYVSEIFDDMGPFDDE